MSRHCCVGCCGALLRWKGEETLRCGWNPDQSLGAQECPARANDTATGMCGWDNKECGHPESWGGEKAEGHPWVLSSLRVPCSVPEGPLCGLSQGWQTRQIYTDLFCSFQQLQGRCWICPLPYKREQFWEPGSLAKKGLCVKEVGECMRQGQGSRRGCVCVQWSQLLAPSLVRSKVIFKRCCKR